MIRKLVVVAAILLLFVAPSFVTIAYGCDWHKECFAYSDAGTDTILCRTGNYTQCAGHLTWSFAFHRTSQDIGIRLHFRIVNTNIDRTYRDQDYFHDQDFKFWGTGYTTAFPNEIIISKNLLAGGAFINMKGTADYYDITPQHPTGP